jgi:hypothetical protein
MMMRSGGRKNPFMSLWLSGANKVAGHARVRILAEARRQQSDMAREIGRAMASFWAAPLGPRPKKRRGKGK